MNILLIHGIAQEKIKEADLLNIWLDTINSSAPGLLSSCDVEMAYYAKELFNFTELPDKSFTTMGVRDLEKERGFLEFSEAYIRDYIRSQNLTKEFDSFDDCSSNQAAHAMDNFFQRNLVRFLSFLEKFSPTNSQTVLEFIKQAYTYLQKPNAMFAIDSLVRPYLLKKPQIVISHSLGTVIAFKLLREMGRHGDELEIPLFITLGSPLSLNSVKDSLGLPRKKPTIVKKWSNFYDPSDIVTLGRGLTESTFSDGINNDGKVDNKTYNCHGVIGYLQHAGVISELTGIINTPGK